MSEVVIVGGHGRIALLLAAALSEQGHTVRSTIRTEAHGAEVEDAGGQPYLFDLERQDAVDLAEVLDGAHAVVFSAGGGADGNAERKRTVDLGGALMTIDAARRAGVRRVVQVSAMGVDDPLPADTDPVWRAYVEAKRDADVALRESGLDWTIVRPGRLTDGPATDQVAIAPRLPAGEVARADVALVLVAVLEDDSTIGAQFDLTSGDRTTSDALAGLP